MSQEKVLKTLESFGLTQPDAQIYVFLGKKGPQKAKDIAKSLRVPRQTLYRAIKSLESKGLIAATLEHPARFSAVPFERVLDLFVKAKTEEAHRIEQDKKGLLSDWQSIAIAEVGDQAPKFTVMEGRNFIYPRLKQMVEDTKSQLSIISTVPGLLRADQFGLLDAAFNHASKTNTKVRFLTVLSGENLKVMKLLLERMPKVSSFEGRTPELGLKLVSRMLIRDDAEAAFFVSQESDADNLCLWTNSKAIVDSFKAIFEDYWRNSTDIQKKIKQMETGKLPPQTSFLQETETTREKHVDAILSAENEIIMITSPENLSRFWKNKTFAQKWAERGVSAKVMVPITSENFEAAKRLSQFIEVRHVPQSYLETTIVDGKHLFQFKQSSSYGEKPAKTLHFQDTFRTDDVEQVERIANAINDIWKTARPLSSVTPETVKPYGLMPPLLSNNHWKVVKDVTVLEEKPGKTTEKDVLAKVISAKKTLDGKRQMYAAAGLAIIRPPDTFNLPDVLLHINQVEKRSIFGRGDSLLVYLWVGTPEGHFFAPGGGIGDNREGVKSRREIFFTENNAKQCYRLAKEDELQIRVYGNSLFCGWTGPIQLYPSKYVMPPACLLVEGYGKIKTKAFSIILPSGFRCDLAYNYFDAFVTFMHPTSKYSGPGTDGAFIRDLVVTTTQPQK